MRRRNPPAHNAGGWRPQYDNKFAANHLTFIKVRARAPANPGSGTLLLRHSAGTAWGTSECETGSVATPIFPTARKPSATTA
jgi:hypothetical protein